MDKVKLTAESLGDTREFTLEHAQAILDHEKNIQCPRWKLDDKNFTLDKNGVIKSTGSSKESKKHETNSGSNQPNQKA